VLTASRPLPTEFQGDMAPGFSITARGLNDRQPPAFTVVLLLGYGFWLLDQLKFMARYKQSCSTLMDDDFSSSSPSV